MAKAIAAQRDARHTDGAMAGARANAQGSATGGPLHDDPREWGPKLERILVRQVSFYRQLRDLSSRQHELIHADSADGLLAVLADRQRVIDQISDLNREVEPFAVRWGELAPKLGSAQRGSLGALLQELDGLVATITARDEEDRVALESRRAEASEALDGLAKKRAAMGAYGGTQSGGVAGPRYQDRKG